MPTQNRKAGSENAGATDSAAAPKEPRVHIIRGIAYPVVRSYYDPSQDAVLDVLEITKTVQTRNGPREVSLLRHVYSTDEELQARYKRGAGPVEIEVTDV